MRGRFLAAATLAAALCVLVGSGPAGSGNAKPSGGCPTGSTPVSIINFAYDPDTLTVPVGTTVCWTNDDPTPHTVSSDDEGLFESGSMAQGETFAYTFNTEGTFGYHCQPHPWMIATVTVTGAPPPPPPTISPEFAVSDTPSAAQVGPSIAFDGANYLATWREGSSSVLGGRVDQFGAHLDGPGIPIGTGSSQRIAFDGTNYFVVWQSVCCEPWLIKGARVSKSGVLLDPDGITLAAGPWQWLSAYSPDVTFNGVDYLALWQLHDDIQNYWISGELVSPSGALGSAGRGQLRL